MHFSTSFMAPPMRLGKGAASPRAASLPMFFPNQRQKYRGDVGKRRQEAATRFLLARDPAENEPSGATPNPDADTTRVAVGAPPERIAPFLKRHPRLPSWRQSSRPTLGGTSKTASQPSIAANAACRTAGPTPMQPPAGREAPRPYPDRRSASRTQRPPEARRAAPSQRFPAQTSRTW